VYFFEKNQKLLPTGELGLFRSCDCLCAFEWMKKSKTDHDYNVTVEYNNIKIKEL
jgi:hypothetical protein